MDGILSMAANSLRANIQHCQNSFMDCGDRGSSAAKHLRLQSGCSGQSGWMHPPIPKFSQLAKIRCWEINPNGTVPWKHLQPGELDPISIDLVGLSSALLGPS